MKILKEIVLKKIKFKRRKLHIRKRVFGTADRPRLSVYRSNKHIYTQVIDDDRGHTLTSASTLSPEIKDKIKELTKTEQARLVGKLLAEKMKNLEIKKVVFDRGGRKYHGRIKALAEGVREGGIQF